MSRFKSCLCHALYRRTLVKGGSWKLDSLGYNHSVLHSWSVPSTFLVLSDHVVQLCLLMSVVHINWYKQVNLVQLRVSCTP